jgi:hypothetical protein
VVVGALPTASLTSCDSEPSEADVVHDHIRLRQHQKGPIARTGVRIIAGHVKHTGTTHRGETVSGSSCSGELSPSGGSTKMISDGCSYANGKVVVKHIGENLLPSAQSGRPGRPGPSVATPGTRNRHIDLPGHLIPGQASVTQLPDLLGRGRVSGSAVTHGDAGLLKLLADGAPMNTQFGTDLTQASTLGVQVGRTLNVHGATVTTVARPA